MWQDILSRYNTEPPSPRRVQMHRIGDALRKIVHRLHDEALGDDPSDRMGEGFRWTDPRGRKWLVEVRLSRYEKGLELLRSLGGLPDR